MASKTNRGLTLTEVVISLGIMAAALLTLMSVSTLALKSRRQNDARAAAARVAEAQLNRTVASVLSDAPVGTQPDYWNEVGGPFTYPARPYRSGTETVGRLNFEWRVYSTDVPAISDAATENRLRLVEAYAWWTDEENGGKRAYASRLVNEKEDP